MNDKEKIIEVFRLLGLEDGDKRKKILSQGVVLNEPESEAINHILLDNVSGPIETEEANYA